MTSYQESYSIALYSKFTMSVYCRTRNFCKHNLCVLVCDIILRECIFVFLATCFLYRHRNICVSNFCDQLEILENAKIKLTQKFPVLQ